MGRGRGLARNEPSKGAKSYTQATAHPTTFTHLGTASAYRLLWAEAVAKMVTAARQAAKLLGRSGQQEW